MLISIRVAKMRRFFSCCRKNSTTVVELVADESRQTPGPQKSVSVPDKPAAAENNKGEGTSWRCRLFSRPVARVTRKKKPVVTSENKPTNKPWWKRLIKKTNSVSPIIDENEVVEFKPLTQEEEKSLGLDDTVLQTVPEKRTEEAVQSVLPGVPQIKVGNDGHPTKTIRQRRIKCVGFPNPVQFCYMNSCLQSLLTLRDFTQSISRQERIWSRVPEAALMRSFIDIERSHFSGHYSRKIGLLLEFNNAILSPEFQDYEQKDAHEFLVCILDEMRSCASRLQRMAARMGRSYSCPVQEHMVFKMLNTRTCKSCGKGSTRVEEFTNLSLDLVPGVGNVEQMLEEYQKEKELEYRCDCGATKSGQRCTFLTMPKVLLLHLKRFRLTPSFQLEKLHKPVDLQRELVLTSNQDGYCYSLVSTINHYGSTLQSGHYICDGMDPDVGQEDPTDRWFTYNDHVVTETSGGRVCDRRKKTSYVLFYKRQD